MERGSEGISEYGSKMDKIRITKWRYLCGTLRVVLGRAWASRRDIYSRFPRRYVAPPLANPVFAKREYMESRVHYSKRTRLGLSYCETVNTRHPSGLEFPTLNTFARHRSSNLATARPDCTARIMAAERW